MRETGSYPRTVQKVNNGVKQVTFWQECKKAQVRVHAEFPDDCCSIHRFREMYHEGSYPHHFPSLQRFLRGNHADHIQFYERSQPWLQILPDIPFTDMASESLPIAWRVLRLRMEERPPIWRADENTSKKQSRTSDKGWSSSMGFGRTAS